MTNEQIVNELKKEASTNKLANAVFHMFALRRRARGVLTIHALKQSMKKEGFEFKASEYEGLFKTLSTIGVGKLDIDYKGRIKGLKDVKLTFKSLGEAALGKNQSISSFKNRPQFNDLKPEERVLKTEDHNTLTLCLQIDNKPAELKIPKTINVVDLVEVLNFFNRSKSS